MSSNGHAIRGTRIGAIQALHSERGEPVPRQRVSYWCANGHETVTSFALYIEVPTEWDCTCCGWPSSRDQHNPPQRRTVKPYKSHLTYVRERRSEEEAEDLLAEALAARAARRGELI
ncbi:RNA polymerase-binding protein RbpA [Glycomyces buryatensis]|uniref:RNA polymerase-binding protein RbpA n=1 Tax=Glycomyces buryatensis TaxID=2570927 RepID=A0A4S8Q2U6_9ACTN|nr:RNA polymerase-binding protein RbpA [Glycomyces buryatensis]THV38517.1 RNA polymerase-binding protein RbpA [Glycomyces buryatensis]